MAPHHTSVFSIQYDQIIYLIEGQYSVINEGMHYEDDRGV